MNQIPPVGTRIILDDNGHGYYATGANGQLAVVTAVHERSREGMADLVTPVMDTEYGDRITQQWIRPAYIRLAYESKIHGSGL